MPQEVHQTTFANGLTLLAEPMPHVRSAAVAVLVPAGYVRDPEDQPGLANVLSEWLTRGAGDRDSRGLSLAMDEIGLDRDSSAGAFNLSLFGTTLGRSVAKTLELFADIVLRPHLPEDELDPIRELALQELKALEDAPDRKAMSELRRRYYPHPLSKDRRGTPEGIAAITPESARAYHAAHFRATGAIVSVAGNIDWPAVRDQVERLFGDWAPGTPAEHRFGDSRPVRAHIEKDTTQTRVCLAYPSVPVDDPGYYAARAAVGVLSGGMSARLFEEVREKRGLVYSVSAGHETFRDRGTVIGYASSRNDRVHETLEVMLAEFDKLASGIELDEIERVQAGLKASLIMAEESSSARARALAGDWFLLGRVRPLDEIQAAVSALTPEAVVEHLRHKPFREPAILTLGPKPLSQTA